MEKVLVIFKEVAVAANQMMVVDLPMRKDE
jgi:hypothetical protein